MFDKAICLAAAGALVLGAFTSSPETTSKQAEGKTFAVDAGHSSVVFSIMHLGTAPFYGRFNKVGGEIAFDADHLDHSSVKIEIPVGSIDTNSEKRDGHLKSPDFFNAAEFPKMTFESTSFKKSGKDEYEITGELTVRGKTKKQTIAAKYYGTNDLGKMGTRMGWSGEFTINRHDFGISWGKGNGALGEDVTVMISLEALPKK